MPEERTIISRPEGFGQAGSGEYVVPIPGTAQRSDPLLLPPGAGEQSETAQTTGDFGTAAADTASFGLYPRAAAARQVGLGNAPNYTAALDAQLKDLAARRERSPTASVFGDLAGAAVGGGGLLAAPRGVALLAGRAAPTLAQQAATSAARRYGVASLEGMTVGGLEGLGHTYSGKPEDYAVNAVEGIGLGGLGGVTAPILGSMIGGAYRIGADRSRTAPGTLVSAARTDDPQLQSMVSRAHNALNTGEPFREMLPDAGPSLLGTAQGAVPGGVGPGRATLVNNLTQRNQTSSPFITGQTTNILGPAVTPSFEQEIIRGQMQALRPHYDAVLNGPNVRAVDTRPIADWLEAEAINSRGKRQAAAQSVRNMLDITGNAGTLDPHPRTLQAVRSDIKNTLRDREGTLTAAERSLLEEADRRMTTELHASVPGIQHIDSRYAELGAQERALATDSPTSRMFRTNTEGVIRPDELRQIMAEAAQPKGSAGPTLEPMRLTQAARAEVERIVGTKPDDLRALENVLGQPQDWNAQKLAIVFGPDRAQRLMDVIGVERIGRDTYQSVVKGSQTAQRSAAAAAQQATGGAANIGDTVWGDVKRLGNYAYNRAINAYSAGTRDRIAQLMAANDPRSLITNAEMLLRTGAARDRRQALTSALTQRAFTGQAGVIPKYNAMPDER